MSHQEQNNFVGLLSTLAVFGYYFWYMFDLNMSGGLAGPDATSVMGKSILWLIVFSIVFHVVAHIIFAIVSAIVTRDPNPSQLVDERDQLIELKGMRVGYYVLGVGFVTSMIALALGQAPVLVFNLIVAAFALASVAENLTRIVLYRNGV